MKKMFAIIGMALVFCILMNLTGCNDTVEEKTVEQKLVETYLTQEYGPADYCVEEVGTYPGGEAKRYMVYVDGDFFTTFDHYTKEDLMEMLE